VEIGRAGIPNPQVVSPLNDLVFSALQGTDAQGHLRWAEVTATGESKSNESIFLAAQKSRLPTAFPDKAKSVISPGATLIFTDRPRRSDDAEPSQLPDSRCAKGQACKGVTNWS
jgi:hypothetical protein